MTNLTFICLSRTTETLRYRTRYTFKLVIHHNKFDHSLHLFNPTSS
jgi:hypothetical protein